MKYETVDDVPEQMQRELGEGTAVLGRKLREWREYASLESLTARLNTADGVPLEITCDDENRVWLARSGAPLDLTPLVDGERG